MKDRNEWNRFIYRAWAPVYDRFIGQPFIVRERKRAIEQLALKKGDSLLILGVGTGPDLTMLPKGLQITGVDLSRAMLSRAKAKLPLEGQDVELKEANAENLPFSDGEFDAVALFLILSVVNNPDKALRETIRVLRPGGRAVVFDKFLPPGRKPSLGRRILNAALMKPFGTDINRRLEPLLEDLPCEKAEDLPSLFRGAYRIITLVKSGESES